MKPDYKNRMPKGMVRGIRGRKNLRITENRITKQSIRKSPSVRLNRRVFLPCGGGGPGGA